jgi:exopolysaccharide biosynthesis polyprenyl glycosylphosphotransferase
MIKVWLYSIASFFSLTVLLTAQHLTGATSAMFMGESLGLVIVLLSCQICFHLNGVDELLVDSKTQVFLQKILKAGGTGLLLAATLFYVFPRLSPGYAAAAASACFLVFALVVLRPVVRSVIRRNDAEETFIVGSETAAQKLYNELIQANAGESLRIVEFSQLGNYRDRTGISRIIVADADIANDSGVTEMLLDFKLRGVQIESAIESSERASRKIWIEGLSPQRLIFAGGFKPSKVYLECKRVVDLVMAVAVLVVTAPIMALVAIAIKLETPGPVIFSQERVGFRGKKFTVYKFRSMRQDAERQTGPTWAKQNDDRITRLGAILRKCRLDELPQAWNVLRGDMSFIGPRPERPYFVDLLKTKIPYYDLRHYVQPGITGWGAQVMYPYGASVEDSYHKLQYDLYYTKNTSFILDLLILFKTIKVVIAGEGR